MPSTTTTLGLFVSTSYIALGLSTFVAPAFGAELLGAKPASSHSSDPTIKLMPLLGARDLTIGIAMTTYLLREDMYGESGGTKAAGILILSGMVLCVADVWSAWKVDWRQAVLLGVGAGIWELIGLRLVNE